MNFNYMKMKNTSRWKKFEMYLPTRRLLKRHHQHHVTILHLYPSLQKGITIALLKQH